MTIKHPLSHNFHLISISFFDYIFIKSSVEIHLKNLFNFCESYTYVYVYVTYKHHTNIRHHTNIIYKSVQLTSFAFSLPLVSLSASPAL